MEGDRILDVVTSPSDLKALSDEELAILACEIREQILETTSQTGGHVASSLGAVEIILAVHSLIDCPHDKFVFDVGHQSYAHKLVTGRLGEFCSLRTHGGLSGFPKPEESPFDVHPSGHASDSLSVAYGLAEARDLRGDDQKIVALIGDASLAGGMAFEALNQIGQSQTPMVIILNDNEMSISRNVGALMKHLGYMRTTTEYRQARDTIQERMERSGPLSRALMKVGRNMKDSMKHMAIPRSMIFEQLGILCTAPIDGHNIGLLKETLAVALAADCPVLVHVVTKKGAGYAPAERDTETFHGIGPFDLETGRAAKKDGAAPSYTSVFGRALVAEAEADDRIVALTAAMKGGTGLKGFADRFPDRFFDEGIAEEHLVAMASGLALGGAKPVVAVYSTFLQRAIDQMIIDCCLPDLDVVFAIDRAGVVGEDGPTHHGMFDLVYTRIDPSHEGAGPLRRGRACACAAYGLGIRRPLCGSLSARRRLRRAAARNSRGARTGRVQGGARGLRCGYPGLRAHGVVFVRSGGFAGSGRNRRPSCGHALGEAPRPSGYSPSRRNAARRYRGRRSRGGRRWGGSARRARRGGLFGPRAQPGYRGPLHPSGQDQPAVGGFGA